MADVNELVETLKKAALEAMEASKPVKVYFGEVVGVSPLRINVEQKMILNEQQLILTRNVTDYVTMVSIDWEAEEKTVSHYHKITNQSDSGGYVLNGRTEEQSVKHNHSITGQKQITIHNGLGVGEGVVLVRQQEGQKFIVLDRIGK